MEKTCVNHPSKKTLKFCHICRNYYCADCLNEGTDFYYCNTKECYEQYLLQKPSEDNNYLNYPRADIFSRLIASVTDWIVLLIFYTIPILIFDIKFTNENVVIETSIFSIIALLYFTFMESSKKQATLGKLFLKIIVIGFNGERISIPKAFVRNVSKFISALPFLMGFIMAAFTKNKQALHDLISRTLVLKLNNEILPAKIICEECGEGNTLSFQERLSNEYDCPECNKKIKNLGQPLKS